MFVSKFYIKTILLILKQCVYTLLKVRNICNFEEIFLERAQPQRQVVKAQGSVCVAFAALCTPQQLSQFCLKTILSNTQIAAGFLKKHLCFGQTWKKQVRIAVTSSTFILGKIVIDIYEIFMLQNIEQMFTTPNIPHKKITVLQNQQNVSFLKFRIHTKILVF